MKTAAHYDVLGSVDGMAVLVLLLLLIRGPDRKFRALAVYAAWEFLGPLGLTIFDLRRTPTQNVLYNHLYWMDEIAADLLLFSVIILLARRATPEGPLRRKIDRLLAAAAGVVLTLPFLIPHPAFDPWPTNKWFNTMAEILIFGAGIMNLALWDALIASRHRDPQLLRVRAGLGIRVAGMAMAYGVRHSVPPGTARFLPNILLLLVQLGGSLIIGGSLILCWAVWPMAKRSHKPDAVAVSP